MYAPDLKKLTRSVSYFYIPFKQYDSVETSRAGTMLSVTPEGNQMLGGGLNFMAISVVYKVQVFDINYGLFMMQLD